jgi:hypothetical protein
MQRSSILKFPQPTFARAECEKESLFACELGNLRLYARGERALFSLAPTQSANEARSSLQKRPTTQKRQTFYQCLTYLKAVLLFQARFIFPI